MHTTLASLFALLSLPDVPHDMYSARGIDSLNPLRQPERIFGRSKLNTFKLLY